MLLFAVMQKSVTYVSWHAFVLLLISLFFKTEMDTKAQQSKPQALLPQQSSAWRIDLLEILHFLGDCCLSPKSPQEKGTTTNI